MKTRFDYFYLQLRERNEAALHLLREWYNSWCMDLRTIPKAFIGKHSSHSDTCGFFVSSDAWSLAFTPCSMSMAVPCASVLPCVPIHGAKCHINPPQWVVSTCVHITASQVASSSVSQLGGEDEDGETQWWPNSLGRLEPEGGGYQENILGLAAVQWGGEQEDPRVGVWRLGLCTDVTLSSFFCSSLESPERSRL